MPIRFISLIIALPAGDNPPCAGSFAVLKCISKAVSIDYGSTYSTVCIAIVLIVR